MAVLGVQPGNTGLSNVEGSIVATDIFGTSAQLI